MAKRFRLGLNFFFDNTSNSGIVNYIYNIVSALNTLDDKSKPKLVVFYSSNAPVEYLQQISYPYIEFIPFATSPSSYLARKTNGLVRRIFKVNLYKKIRYFSKIDSLYPYFAFVDNEFREVKNKIHWLVDFNNMAFPDHYPDKGMIVIKYHQEITSKPGRVVLSSFTLLDELKRYYPAYQCEVKVLRFASSLPVLDEEKFPALANKYHLDLPYLMSPNQFWEHKNQSVVIEALQLIKESRPELRFKILFTGSLEVNRGKGLYIDKLRQKLDEYALQDYILFLGVLDRQEQLLLMKHASMLLQPSFYEGWSTLVEEAKALNKFILLSDLPVHREQISENVEFFCPENARELADKIIRYLVNPPHVKHIDYRENINQFGVAALDALTYR